MKKILISIGTVLLLSSSTYGQYENGIGKTIAFKLSEKTYDQSYEIILAISNIQDVCDYIKEDVNKGDMTKNNAIFYLELLNEIENILLNQLTLVKENE